MFNTYVGGFAYTNKLVGPLCPTGKVPLKFLWQM